MRLEPRNVRHALLWAWLACGWLTRDAHAQEAESRMRLLVRVTSDADRALLERIRGQLSDVSVELVTVETPAIELGLRDQLESAQRLAKEHDAPAVVWFQAATDGDSDVLVHIATPATDRVATRRVRAQDPDVGSESAVLESSALVVRSAARALADGGVIGVSRDQAIADSLQARATPASAPPTPSTSAPAIANSAASVAEPPRATTDASRAMPGDALAPTRVSWISRLGARATIDVGAGVALWSLAAASGIRIGDLVLLAHAQLGLPSDADNGPVVMRLSRHALGGSLGLSWRLGPRWQVEPSLALGAAMYRRSTDIGDAAATARPASTTTSVSFGPAVSLAYRASWIGASLSAGCDALPSRPRFTVLGNGQSFHVRPGALQPYLVLAMTLEVP